MKTINQGLTQCIFYLVIILFSIISSSALGQEKRILLYDSYHGENSKNGKVFESLLLDTTSITIEIGNQLLDDSLLNGKFGIIIFSPTKSFQDLEKKAIVNFLNSGGSLILIFDEERRMSLTLVGVNDIILPFGLELTVDAPVPHNCGAIADKSEVCADIRELPYSGGRSIKGGTIISKVNDDGNYVHCAYTKLSKGGKIIVMSDGMAGLLLGKSDGERFSGTGPSDSKYWGKDSRIFMQEIFAFLLK